MFHHDDRVAQISQFSERLEQPSVVARMQSDGRFVQDVQDTGQSAADLTGKADALCLTSRQRRQRACQRQVVQTDIDQERQSSGRLLEQVARDLLLRLRQCEPV